MKKSDLLTLGLTDELAEKVAALSAEEMKEFIPKSRFNEVNEAKKSLEERIKDYDKQLDTLKKEAGDAESLKTKINELQEQNKHTASEYEKKLAKLQLDHAIENALSEAKAKNAKAVKALLDLDDVEIDEKGKVKGLDKQIKKLVEAEDTAFLFDKASEGKQGDGQGNNPNNGGKPMTNLAGMHPAGNQGGNAGGSGMSIGAAMAARYNATVQPISGNNNGGNESAQ